MRYEAKSVVFGRKPRQEGSEFKTAFFKLYDSNTPFVEEFPVKELDFPNTEKVELKDLELDYYLEGNDLVITGIKSIDLEVEDTVLKIKVEK